MKIAILITSLLSLGASALPEAEESITVGEYTYTGGDLPKGELKTHHRHPMASPSLWHLRPEDQGSINSFRDDYYLPLKRFGPGRGRIRISVQEQRTLFFKVANTDDYTIFGRQQRNMSLLKGRGLDLEV
ncbi:hypothetical protein E4U44_003520 [Claviceps purpurea]|nr:hypothetical protein E4U44_003520 [Claviceps purpurea]